jgi:hypothetical protein
MTDFAVVGLGYVGLPLAQAAVASGCTESGWMHLSWLFKFCPRGDLTSTT